MLDAFEIITSSGIVLWRKQYSSSVPASIINSLINDIFIEERAGARQAENSTQSYKKEKYTLKWTGAKDVGLIFVVGTNRRSTQCSRTLVANCMLFRPSIKA